MSTFKLAGPPKDCTKKYKTKLHICHHSSSTHNSFLLSLPAHRPAISCYYLAGSSSHNYWSLCVREKINREDDHFLLQLSVTLIINFPSHKHKLYFLAPFLHIVGCHHTVTLNTFNIFFLPVYIMAT